MHLKDEIAAAIRAFDEARQAERDAAVVRALAERDHHAMAEHSRKIDAVMRAGAVLTDLVKHVSDSRDQAAVLSDGPIGDAHRKIR